MIVCKLNIASISRPDWLYLTFSTRLSAPRIEYHKSYFRAAWIFSRPHHLLNSRSKTLVQRYYWLVSKTLSTFISCFADKNLKLTLNLTSLSLYIGLKTVRLIKEGSKNIFGLLTHEICIERFSESCI